MIALTISIASFSAIASPPTEIKPASTPDFMPSNAPTTVKNFWGITNKKIPLDDLKKHLGLSDNNQLTHVLQLPDANENIDIKIQQKFKNTPILSQYLVAKIDKQGNVISLIGSVIKNIPDTFSVTPILNDKQALARLKSLFPDKISLITNSNPTTLFVDLNEKNNPRLVYITSFHQTGNNPINFMAMIDANTGRIINYAESPKTDKKIKSAKVNKVKEHGTIRYGKRDFSVMATGTGGNGNTGKYTINELPAAIYPWNGSCHLIDMVRKIETYKAGDEEPYGFKCTTSPESDVSGGYSPYNDAHFFSGLAIDMLKSYTGINSPLTSPLRIYIEDPQQGTSSSPGGQWNPDQKTISLAGGDDANYPSAILDLVAHEVTHGFTQENTTLGYDPGYSAGMNEAFSDMAGEAAKYYAKIKYPKSNYGNDDFLMGIYASKQKEATRDMCSDNYSFGKNSGQDGRTFCVLAKKDNWNTMKAFKVFARANILYMKSGMNYNEQSCYVSIAAQDLNYSVDDVKSAYATQGVSCPSGMPEHFEPIAVNGFDYTFTDDVGFPTTGYSGAQFQLSLNTIDDISWSSSNPQIATVNQKGLITLQAKGKADITANNNKGGTLTYHINTKTWYTPTSIYATPEGAKEYCNSIQKTVPLVDSLVSPSLADGNKGQVGALIDEWGAIYGPQTTGRTAFILTASQDSKNKPIFLYDYTDMRTEDTVDDWMMFDGTGQVICKE